MFSDRPDALPPATRIPRCARTELGYDVPQVDEFLAAVHAALECGPEAAVRPGTLGSTQVRAAVFAGTRGGYRPAAVDELLDEAEDALAAAERARCLRERGPQAWQEHLDTLTRSLRHRLERPRTRRFRHPSRARALGYSAAHVDVLCERLEARLGGTAPLEPAEVRRAVFPPAHGERGYEEHQVDAFLDRAVQLLLALR